MVGRIINSYIANLFPACFPPLITLKQGTGKMNFYYYSPAFLSLWIYSYKGIFNSAAPALATAKDTAKIALAPNFSLGKPYLFLFYLK